MLIAPAWTVAISGLGAAVPQQVEQFMGEVKSQAQSVQALL